VIWVGHAFEDEKEARSESEETVIPITRHPARGKAVRLGPDGWTAGQSEAAGAWAGRSRGTSLASSPWPVKMKEAKD